MPSTFNLCWWCPSSGTQEYLTSGELAHVQSFEYVQKVAQKCELYGFHDILIPISPRCLEPTIVATVIGKETSTLNMMLAIRPGHWNPVHFARSIASLQLLYPERIKINYVEGNFSEMIAEGDLISDIERPKRKEEFIEIVDRLLQGEVVTLNTKHYKINNCQLPQILCPQKKINCMISGHTNESFELAVKTEHNILIYGGAPNSISNLVESVRKIGNRNIRLGMSIQIFARPTKREAEDAANKFISKVLEKHQTKSINYHNERPIIDQLHVDAIRKNNYWVNDVLWYGLIKGRIHQRASLVGSYSTIAEELIKYNKLGISYFILTAESNDKELDYIGKNVLPLLNEKLSK